MLTVTLKLLEDYYYQFRQDFGDSPGPKSGQL